MARTVVPLTDTKIKSAKAKDKNYTLSDGQGLHLLVKCSGSKLWEFIYKSPVTLKRRKSSFGNYPNVTLVTARKKRAEYQELIINGIDPIDHFKQIKEDIKQAEKKEAHTIGKIIDQYYDFKEDELSTSTIKKDKSRINYSFVNHLPKKEDTNIHDVTFEIIISILEPLEISGKLETLKKVKGIIIRLLKFIFKRNISNTSELIGKLELYEFKKQSKKQIKHNPTLTTKEDITRLYNDILVYNHNLITKYLLIFTIHTAQRQGSLITAKWEDIDFRKKLWVIPEHNMKVKTADHHLPLSDVTIKYIKELQDITGDSEYLFPNSQINKTRNKYPHISNNTVTSALRSMGYTKKEQTAHGFRAMFKTVCKEHQEEHNLNNEFVERILAHKVEGEVEASYNRAKNIEDMRKVANWWSNYLENLL